MLDIVGLRPPPGACDCHVHIFGPTAPAGTPQWATVEAFREMSRRLGIERAVLVQPNGLRTDNSIMIASIAALAPEARGVAIVDPSVTDEELDRLTRAGICGARLHMLPGGMLTWDDLQPIAARVAPFGWHIQLQMDGRTLHEKESELKGLPLRLVIDHIGKFLEPVSVNDPGFLAMLRLLDTGRCWLKLSAPYEVSREGPPNYGDVAALAKAAAKAAPQRMLWGSNWPHASLKAGLPDDVMLFNLLDDWLPDDETRKAVLVDNPVEVYGFTGASP